MKILLNIIKYFAIALAIFLVVSIFEGVMGILGSFAGPSSSGDAVGDLKSYSVSSDTTSLDIEINAADFTVKQGEIFSVETNLKGLKVEEKNGKLTIEDKKHFSSGTSYNGAFLTLTIPSDTVFEKVNIITGAGRFTVESLTTDILNFELGAGEVICDKITASRSADIDGGAGKITVTNGSFHDLDFDMGIGQLNFTAALSGKSEFDLGVGESNITVIGSKDEYSLDIEKGIGTITLDGKNISNTEIRGGSAGSIDISGGIGAVNVNFKKGE